MPARRGVPALEDAANGGRHDPERREPVLRVARFYLLLDDADPGDTRGFRCDLDGLLETIAEVIEFTI